LFRLALTPHLGDDLERFLAMKLELSVMKTDRLFGRFVRCRALLDAGCSVGSGCTLGACTYLDAGEKLPDETVVVGPGLRHYEPGAREAHVQAVLKYIEVLKETLPRCHHLRKSNVKS
ncbi:unnamed protein product, partial [Effrenium voratum]